jgi:hypothetical protein
MERSTKQCEVVEGEVGEGPPSSPRPLVSMERMEEDTSPVSAVDVRTMSATCRQGLSITPRHPVRPRSSYGPMLSYCLFYKPAMLVLLFGLLSTILSPFSLGHQSPSGCRVVSPSLQSFSLPSAPSRQRPPVSIESAKALHELLKCDEPEGIG